MSMYSFHMLLVAVKCTTLPLYTALTGGTMPVTEYGQVSVACITAPIMYRWSSSAMGTSLTATCYDAGSYTAAWSLSDTCIPAPIMTLCYTTSAVPCTMPGTCQQQDIAPLNYTGEIISPYYTGCIVRLPISPYRIDCADRSLLATLVQCFRAQMGLKSTGSGSYTVLRTYATSCATACSTYTGYQYLHCWSNSAPGNLPPNSLALWDYTNNRPPTLPAYTGENGYCLRMPFFSTQCSPVTSARSQNPNRRQAASVRLNAAVKCSALPPNTRAINSGFTLPVYENGAVQLLCSYGYTWNDTSISANTNQTAYCMDAGNWTSFWLSKNSLSCTCVSFIIQIILSKI